MIRGIVQQQNELLAREEALEGRDESVLYPLHEHLAVHILVIVLAVDQSLEDQFAA